MKRIAVVGSGIAGLGAAYVLSRRHEVHLFEREARVGGHTHTVVVDTPEGPLPLDTGFLVHNDRTYPNLVRLFAELGVATRDSDMSFAVACRQTGLEYSSRGASGYFAQWRNLVSRRHLRLLRDILRFNREASALVAQPAGGAGDDQTLGQFLDARRFDDGFIRHYLFPMASAIWSSSLDSIDGFPVRSILGFLANHGLLTVTDQPVWKVLAGGSHSYVPALLAAVSGATHTGITIAGIRRDADGVTLSVAGRPAMRFDEVVLACHGDQVLPLLADPTDREREVFASFTTTTNEAWLHTDGAVLPTRPAARASWNYLLAGDGQGAPTVTYDLNRLQGLTAGEQYCVTLNPRVPIDPARVLRKIVYAHPLYTRDAVRAQGRWAEVSGVRRTHYCGAYWLNGFHEDGFVSALRVARALEVPW